MNLKDLLKFQKLSSYLFNFRYYQI